MPFGDAGPLLYPIRDTKGTTLADELRGTENQKILCGFPSRFALRSELEAALRADYQVFASAMISP